jgi:glucose-1-phosphate cytidylyltransferase
MKTVLFCGGLGTRIREYSESIPKPMIPIADRPILWHLMNYYGQFGTRILFCALVIRRTLSGVFPEYRPQTYADCSSG